MSEPHAAPKPFSQRLASFSWNSRRKFLICTCILPFSFIFFYTFPANWARFCDAVTCNPQITKHLADGPYFLYMTSFTFGLALLLLLGAILRPQVAVVAIFLASFWAAFDGMRILIFMMALILYQSEIALTPADEIAWMILPSLAVLISGWFALRQIGAWIGQWVRGGRSQRGD